MTQSRARTTGRSSGVADLEQPEEQQRRHLHRHYGEQRAAEEPRVMVRLGGGVGHEVARRLEQDSRGDQAMHSQEAEEAAARRLTRTSGRAWEAGRRAARRRTWPTPWLPRSAPRPSAGSLRRRAWAS